MEIEKGISNQPYDQSFTYSGIKTASDAEQKGISVKQEKSGQTGECETCKKRKYQDGSDENVSFKAASHIAPEAAASTVRAHEGEHVSNAYEKAVQNNGKVLRASVSLHTGVCPECGKVYVSGGTTTTQIQYSDEENPYQQDKRTQDAIKFGGQGIDMGI